MKFYKVVHKKRMDLINHCSVLRIDTFNLYRIEGNIMTFKGKYIISLEKIISPKWWLLSQTHIFSLSWQLAFTVPNSCSLINKMIFFNWATAHTAQALMAIVQVPCSLREKFHVLWSYMTSLLWPLLLEELKVAISNQTLLINEQYLGRVKENFWERF